MGKFDELAKSAQEKLAALESAEKQAAAQETKRRQEQEIQELQRRFESVVSKETLGELHPTYSMQQTALVSQHRKPTHV